MNSNLRPPTRTCIDPETHASAGKAYPFVSREEIMWTWTNSRQELTSPHTRAKQAAYVHASWSTI